MQSLYGAIANTNKKEIMAISVDRVYQKVLALANKEQRGYITPQEFNLFADQAQMEIFEQYFYDLDQIKRRMDVDNDGQHQTAQASLEDKIDIFLRTFISTPFTSDTGSVVLDPWIYKLSMVTVTYKDVPSQWAGTKRTFTTSTAERISHDNYRAHSKGYLTSPTHSRPTYKMRGSGWSDISESWRIQIQPYPNPATDDIHLDYILRPKTPNWTYVINGENALYNPNAADHQDFELHMSEETNLVNKILQLSGVSIKDFNLAQLAGQKEANTIQQQKQ